MCCCVLFECCAGWEMYRGTRRGSFDEENVLSDEENALFDEENVLFDEENVFFGEENMLFEKENVLPLLRQF